MPMLRDWLLPAVYFGLIYWGIGQYDHSIEVYRNTLTTAAMVVANLLLVSYWVLDKRTYVLPARTALFWLAFFSLGFLSSAFADNTHSAFGQLRLYFSVFLLGLGFRVWVGQPSQRMVIGFLLALCLAHVFILVLVLGYAAGFVSDPLTQGASIPYHGNIRHVAHHGMVAACAGLALFLIGGRFRLAGYLLGAISTFGLVFLGQRGGLLGFGVFIVVAAYFLPNVRHRIAITGALTVLVSLAMVYTLDANGITNRYSGSIAERVRTGGTEAFTSTSGRLSIWRDSVGMALERPILGFGPDGFRYSKIRLHSYPIIVQPHNLIVQMLLEFGVAGLVLASLFLYRLFRQPFVNLMRARKNGGADLSFVLLFALLMGFLSFSLLEGLFYHSVSLLIIAVLAPLTFAASTGAVTGDLEITTSPRDIGRQH